MVHLGNISSHSSLTFIFALHYAISHVIDETTLRLPRRRNIISVPSCIWILLMPSLCSMTYYTKPNYYIINSKIILTLFDCFPMKENQGRAYQNQVYILIYMQTFKTKHTSPPT